jgi:prepilin-type N-terminal cleavage/methylation domain-containing protein
MKSTYIKNNKKFLNSSYQAGLTFIELIVVMSIFSIIASVVLFNFSSFNTNITSQNLAQQIALQIKQAQTESISGTRTMVFEEDEILNPERAPTYGVRFDIDTEDAANYLDSKSMIYFADRNGDGEYQHVAVGNECDYGTSGTECLARIQINTGDSIVGICSDASCDLGTYDELKATILFRRPFPEARLYVGDDLTPRSKIGIKVRSSRGAERVIMTTILGQVSVFGIDTQ